MRPLPKPLVEALEATGLPWTLERGKKHWQLLLAGRMVTILPQSGKALDGGDPRSIKNNIAAVRRAAREMGHG